MPPALDRTDRSTLKETTAGFALAALVIATIAVVVPRIDSSGADQLRAAALSDINRIGIALRAATSDLGDAMLPAGGPLCCFFGPGVLPRGVSAVQRNGFPLSGLLAADRVRAGACWRGPYLDRVPIDPWGRAYVVNLPRSRSGAVLSILSAGPDGVLDTAKGCSEVQGDDVGIVLMP